MTYLRTHPHQRRDNDIALLLLLPRNTEQGLHALSLLLLGRQPGRRVTLDRRPATSRAIPVDPFEQVPDILLLLVVQRMEDPAHSLCFEFGPVFFPLLALLGKAGVAGEDGGDDDGLEVEERERRRVVGNADEGQRRVWDVEDVLVQVVHLRAVRHQDGVAGFGGGGLVLVVVGQEGEGYVVPGAEDDGVDVAELLPGLEMDDEGEGGVGRECRVGRVFLVRDFKSLDLAHPDAILG